MLRSNNLFVVAMLALFLPMTATAEDVAIVGGGFAFLHHPVDLGNPNGYCVDPPGLSFSVESNNFTGAVMTKKDVVLFQGKGEATGCAFLEPVNGVAGEFDGSFTWQTAEGELRGTFELIDIVTETEGVFAVVIFITFDGGTGRFEKAKGEAIAEGFDFPFGGLGNTAGVVAEITEGELKLKRNLKGT